MFNNVFGPAECDLYFEVYDSVAVARLFKTTTGEDNNVHAWSNADGVILGEFNDPEENIQLKLLVIFPY